MEKVREKWETILKQVKTESDMSEIAFQTWLVPLKIHSVDGDCLYIVAPNDLTIQYIKRKLDMFLKVAVTEVSGQGYEINYVTEQTAAKLKHITTEKQETVTVSKRHLSSKYTFDNFVVGENNRFAHASALAVAEMPGEAYNPLYLHGGAGRGKTHLVQAIGNYILQRNPEKKIVYVTSEAFTHEVIDAIRNGSKADITRMREKYRTCDVLIIDDIQFLIGKESTQNEFFHTFNELHLDGKQIIITSDRPPREFNTLSERMVSRYSSGLMADIGLPSYELRMAILRKNTMESKMDMDEAVLRYIANHFKTNIRELEGALSRVVAYARFNQEPITLEMAERELACYLAPEDRKEVTPQLIIEVVAEHYHISVEEMISKKRGANIVRPRQIAMYLCSQMTNISLNLIGSTLGKRDHTTILYGCRKIEDELQKDPQLVATIEVIKKKISP